MPSRLFDMVTRVISCLLQSTPVGGCLNVHAILDLRSRVRAQGAQGTRPSCGKRQGTLQVLLYDPVHTVV